MTSLPIDSIHVEIEAQLGRLRSQMGQAEKLVDDTTRRMGQTTSRQGAFAFLGLGELGRFGRALSAFQLVRSSLDGLKAAAESTEHGWARAMKGAEAFADTLTFGLHRVLVDIMAGFTGLPQAAAQAMEDANRMTKQAGGLQQVQLSAADVAVAEAQGPLGKAMAQRRKRELEIEFEARRLDDEGWRMSDIQKYVRLEKRRADIEAAESWSGGDVSPARVDDMLRYMQEIARTTARGP